MLENSIGYFDRTKMSAHDYSENIFAYQYDTALNHFWFMLLKGTVFRIGSKQRSLIEAVQVQS